MMQRTTQKYGKTNRRQIARMADEMADEARAARFPRRDGFGGSDVNNLPDWAGLAWIISPYYNSQVGAVRDAMGEEWWTRAEVLVKAIDGMWRNRQ